MNTKNSILQEIKTIIDMGLQLDKTGGPEGNYKDFENYLDHVDELLTRFGLPNSSKYVNILSPVHFKEGYQLEAVLEKLEDTAGTYLLSNAKSEPQLLKDAIRFKIDAFDLLPELKISTHTYTLFVYEEILLKQKDEPMKVLQAMRFAQESASLNELGILSQSEQFDYIEKAMLQELQARGIQYLDEFVQSFAVLAE
ncbi:MAG: hypothetical protein IPK03_12050 [Bacteroidetes bacterium]|nr:hypothetical protein [Bacteroidota bacterium]